MKSKADIYVGGATRLFVASEDQSVSVATSEATHYNGGVWGYHLWAACFLWAIWPKRRELLTPKPTTDPRQLLLLKTQWENGYKSYFLEDKL